MSSSENFLKKYANDKMKFVVFPESGEIEARYFGASSEPNKFDGGKTECARYHLEIDGVLKFLDRTSGALARQMSKIPEGTMIKIKKVGERSKTKYFIQIIEE